MKYQDYISYLQRILNGNVQTVFDDLLNQAAVLPASMHAKNIKEAIQAIRSYCESVPPPAGSTKADICQSLTASAAPPQLAGLPLVLCGPMVRRAEPGTVTVWVALKEERKNVTLNIYASSPTEAPLLTGKADTVAFGESIHIVAITAKAAAGKELEYGKAYLYDLVFHDPKLNKDFGLKGEQILNHKDVALSVNPITYEGAELPSFVLPPLDANKIHIIHSSCRNMDNSSYDSMPGLDKVMEDEWEGKRPQQLFLSGDQIYADEANEVAEHLYITLGNALMNKTLPEHIPTKEDYQECFTPSEIAPGERGEMNKDKTTFKINGKYASFIEVLTQSGLLNDTLYKDEANRLDYIHDLCGLTPTSRFHLLTLSDFFALYLLNWSETLWPEMYRQQEFKDWAIKHSIAYRNGVKDNLLGALMKAKDKLGKKTLEKFIEDLNKTKTAEAAKRVTYVKLVRELRQVIQVIQNLINLTDQLIFTSGLGKVRRTLANIATYMIFDDHEITDDWHMTREWVQRIYSKPAGRRVMLNGLAAYAVFQAWGNTPDRFEAADSSGRQLLNTLSAWIKEGYGLIVTKKIENGKEKKDIKANKVNEEKIANFLKIPKTAQVKKFQEMGPGSSMPEIFEKPLLWHYQVNHPIYEVLVLDSRTFRTFPGSLYRAGEHMSEKSLKEQLPAPAPLPAPHGDKLKELTFVIASCNVVTIPLFRNFLGAVALPFAYYMKGDFDGNRWKMLAYNPDMSDSWEVSTKLFETMLSRLAVRSFEKQPDAKKESRVVILSGDVHFSYAARLGYWADKPFGGQEKPHEMVIAHLTASGMKNEATAWKDLQLDKMGYEYTDVGKSPLKLPAPEIMVGYAKAPEAMNKEKKDEIVLRTRWFPNYKPGMILQEPILLPHHKVHPEVKIPKPEWAYQIDFIRGNKVKTIQNINELSHFDYAREQAPSTEIIRHSSFASITIDWEGEGKLAVELLDKTHETLQVIIEKAFPPPPFYIIVEEEIMYVAKAPGTSTVEATFTVRRGKGKEAKEHPKGAAVKIRRGVTQTNWMIAPPKQDEEQKLQPAALTSFKVPMASNDPQYTKPSFNTL